MAGVKIVVIYPRPTNIEEFEKLYLEEHMPMAAEHLAGKTRAVLTRTLDTPQGTPPFHRLIEIYFPSMAALQACASSEGGKATLEHATKISTGGPPIVMIAEDETIDFNTTRDDTLS